MVTVCESSPSSPLWRVPTTSLLISIWNWSSIIIMVVVVITIIANIINTIVVVNINVFIIKMVIFLLETDSPLTSHLNLNWYVVMVTIIILLSLFRELAPMFWYQSNCLQNVCGRSTLRKHCN